MTSVSIAINAIDNASQVFNKMTQAANRSVNQIQSSFNGLDKVATSALKGIQGAALGLASTALDFGVDKLKERFQDAQQVQMDLIGTTGNLMFALNTGFDEASSFANKLHAEAVRLGAALPGVAEEYGTVIRGISNDVALAFRDIHGNIDLDRVENSVKSLGRQWTLMAKQTGTEASKAAGILMRLIAGDRNPLLRGVMLTKSPGFKEALNSLMAAQGKTLDNWKEVSSEQRVKWLEAAANMALPEAAVTKMTQTVSGTINTWNNAIFEATTGVLGMLRQLGNRGGATVMSALHQLLLTSEQTFNELLRLFPFQGDPMVMLHDAIMGLNGLMEGAGNFFASIRNASGTVTEGIKGFSAALLPNILGAFDSVMLTIGTSIPAIVNQITTMYNGVIFAIPWSEYGHRVGSGFVTLLSEITASIMHTLAGLDYGQILAALFQTVAGLHQFFRGVFAGVRETVFGNLMQTTSIITQAALDGLSAIGQMIAGAFRQLPGLVAGGVSSMISNINASLQSAFSGAVGRITNPIGAVNNAASGYIPNAATGLNGGGLMDAVNREMRQKPSGSGLVVANTSETILTQPQALRVAETVGTNQFNLSPTVNLSLALQNRVDQDMVDLILSEIGRELNQHRLTF